LRSSSLKVRSTLEEPPDKATEALPETVPPTTDAVTSERLKWRGSALSLPRRLLTLTLPLVIVPRAKPLVTSKSSPCPVSRAGLKRTELISIPRPPIRPVVTSPVAVYSDPLPVTLDFTWKPATLNPSALRAFELRAPSILYSGPVPSTVPENLALPPSLVEGANT